jgi:hypothetical protein
VGNSPRMCQEVAVAQRQETVGLGDPFAHRHGLAAARLKFSEVEVRPRL